MKKFSSWKFKRRYVVLQGNVIVMVLSLLQMNETLLEYLQEKLKEGDAVLAADKKVTEEEKKAEG